jgi:hypothetical protein
MNISDETNRATVFWDWIVGDEGTVWSRRFLMLMGIDLDDAARAQALDFVLSQPFWKHVNAHVAEARLNGTMINERGSFTNPRAETVTVWALGQRITAEDAAASGVASYAPDLSGSTQQGAVVKVRFSSVLDEPHIASLQSHERMQTPE